MTESQRILISVRAEKNEPHHAVSALPPPPGFHDPNLPMRRFSDHVGELRLASPNFTWPTRLGLAAQHHFDLHR